MPGKKTHWHHLVVRGPSPGLQKLKLAGPESANMELRKEHSSGEACCFAETGRASHEMGLLKKATASHGRWGDSPSQRNRPVGSSVDSSPSKKRHPYQHLSDKQTRAKRGVHISLELAGSRGKRLAGEEGPLSATGENMETKETGGQFHELLLAVTVGSLKGRLNVLC